MKIVKFKDQVMDHVNRSGFKVESINRYLFTDYKVFIYYTRRAERLSEFYPNFIECSSYIRFDK